VKAVDVGKGKRLKRKRQGSAGGFFAEIAARLTANFQRELRKSELWDQMVAEFGEKRAEELLRECQADVRPGLAPDGSRDRPENLS
jgi:hypothetical protein